jgi:hypothetical protein
MPDASKILTKGTASTASPTLEQRGYVQSPTNPDKYVPASSPEGQAITSGKTTATPSSPVSTSYSSPPPPVSVAQPSQQAEVTLSGVKYVQADPLNQPGKYYKVMPGGELEPGVIYTIPPTSPSTQSTTNIIGYEDPNQQRSVLFKTPVTQEEFKGAVASTSNTSPAPVTAPILTVPTIPVSQGFTPSIDMTITSAQPTIKTTGGAAGGPQPTPTTITTTPTFGPNIVKTPTISNEALVGSETQWKGMSTPEKAWAYTMPNVAIASVVKGDVGGITQRAQEQSYQYAQSKGIGDLSKNVISNFQADPLVQIGESFILGGALKAVSATSLGEKIVTSTGGRLALGAMTAGYVGDVGFNVYQNVESGNIKGAVGEGFLGVTTLGAGLVGAGMGPKEIKNLFIKSPEQMTYQEHLIGYDTGDIVKSGDTGPALKIVKDEFKDITKITTIKGGTKQTATKVIRPDVTKLPEPIKNYDVLGFRSEAIKQVTPNMEKIITPKTPQPAPIEISRASAQSELLISPKDLQGTEFSQLAQKYPGQTIRISGNKIYVGNEEVSSDYGTAARLEAFVKGGKPGTYGSVGTWRPVEMLKKGDIGLKLEPLDKNIKDNIKLNKIVEEANKPEANLDNKIFNTELENLDINILKSGEGFSIVQPVIPETQVPVQIGETPSVLPPMIGKSQHGAYFSTVGTIMPKSTSPVETQAEIYSHYQGPFPLSDESRALIQKQQQQSIQGIEQGQYPAQNIFGGYVPIQGPTYGEIQTPGKDIGFMPIQDITQRQQTITRVGQPFPSPIEPGPRDIGFPDLGFPGFRRKKKGRKGKLPIFGLGYSEKWHKIAQGQEVFAAVGMKSVKGGFVTPTMKGGFNMKRILKVFGGKI